MYWLSDRSHYLAQSTKLTTETLAWLVMHIAGGIRSHGHDPKYLSVIWLARHLFKICIAWLIEFSQFEWTQIGGQSNNTVKNCRGVGMFSRRNNNTSLKSRKDADIAILPSASSPALLLDQLRAGLVQAWMGQKLVNVTFYKFFDVRLYKNLRRQWLMIRNTKRLL